MSKKNMKERGQVTIFIIIALIIVLGLLIYFLWIGPTYVSPQGAIRLESCTEEVVGNAIKELGDKGGFIEPEFTFSYKGKEIPYLCYTNLYYVGCINQNPFLIENFENQLLKKTREEIYSCYKGALDGLKAQGYKVATGDKNLDIELEPGKAVVLLKAPVVLENEGSQKFTEFRINVNSRIYEMLSIATSIVQFETKYGDSDITSMMVFYPDYIIDKLKQGEGTTIYIMEDKDFGTKFQFASRSYAWPPGYGQKSKLIE